MKSKPKSDPLTAILEAAIKAAKNDRLVRNWFKKMLKGERAASQAR